MLRSNLVYHRLLPDAAHPHLGQLRACRDGSIAFIHQYRGQIKAPFEAVGKAAAEPCHFVWRTVVVARQANHQSGGLPLFNQRGYRGKTLLVLFTMQGDEWLSGMRNRIAYRHTNALDAKVESQ